MKRINLTKFGFVRSKEDDFSDDGNRFICYKIGKIRVSKLVSDGQAYITCSMDDNKLAYEVYSKLPHYNDLDISVDTSSITEEDLQDLYTTCVEYEKEYEAAVKTIVYPTQEELDEQRLKIENLRKAELKEIESKIDASILNLREYDLTSLQKYYRDLKASTKGITPQLNSSYSINYVKDTNYDLQPGCWYRSCLELLAKVSIV